MPASILITDTSAVVIGEYLVPLSLAVSAVS